MTTPQQFLYVVVSIPTDQASINFYTQCSKSYSYYFGSSTPDFAPPYYTGCGVGEMMINPKFDINEWELKNNIEWQCVAGTVNDPILPTCSIYPPTNPSAAPSSSAGAVSIYTYLNGIPSVPVPNSTGIRIPSIGGQFPINLVITDPADHPITGTAFCATTVETASGTQPNNPQTQTPTVQCSALVLVYDLAWIKTWADVDYFAPLSEGGIKSSIFINQGSGNTCDPQGNFYLSTGQPYQKGAQVPTLEQQWPTILASFCAQPITAASNGLNPCRAGVNTGLNSCSNILGLRTDGGPNYCWQGYQAFINPPAGLNPAIPAAVNSAMITYCNNFPVVNGTPQAPPECYCVTPTAQTSYQTLVQQMEKLAYSLPTDPASSASTPFGPMGCWYVPCTYGQSTVSLIPQNILISPNKCPKVCENIVQIFNTGEQSGTIDLSGANIEQTITCCASGSCTVSSTCNPACSNDQTCINGKCVQGQACGVGQTDCPSGQTCQNGVCVTACNINSDCPKDSTCVNGTCQKTKLFFSEYWIFVIVALLFLFFFILVLFLIFKK